MYEKNKLIDVFSKYEQLKLSPIKEDLDEIIEINTDIRRFYDLPPTKMTRRELYKKRNREDGQRVRRLREFLQKKKDLEEEVFPKINITFP